MNQVRASYANQENFWNGTGKGCFNIVETSSTNAGQKSLGAMETAGGWRLLCNVEICNRFSCLETAEDTVPDVTSDLDLRFLVRVP